MNKICPVCGKEGSFGFLNDIAKDDEEAGLFHHVTGHENGTDLFGRPTVFKKYETHVVTMKTLKEQFWFSEFKKERDAYYKKHFEEQEKKWNDEMMRQFNEEDSQ